MKVHADSLRVLSLSKNKVSNAFMEYICDGLAELNHIQEINLVHLKDLRSMDWVKIL